MRNEHNDQSLATHGIGAGLVAILGIFARSADDVARMGVHCVDDVGRACVTQTDDISQLMSRSGDDLFRQVDDFHLPNHIDELRVELSPARTAATEGDNGINLAPHVGKEVVKLTAQIAEQAARDDDQ
jgi:hypothetical protein